MTSTTVDHHHGSQSKETYDSTKDSTMTAAISTSDSTTTTANQRRRTANRRHTMGPVHAYVAVPGGKACYLSEWKAGKEVIVGRVKIVTQPLILEEAKRGASDHLGACFISTHKGKHEYELF